MSVLADQKNRGVMDVFFVVCDGLKGLPDSVNAVFPAAIVQACVIHLIPADDCHAAVRLAHVLGPAREGPAGDLHRPECRRRVGGVRGAGVGSPLGRSEASPTRRSRSCRGQRGRSSHRSSRTRRRDTPGLILYQRDRVVGRPLPPGRRRQGSLPYRAGRAQNRLS